MAKAFILSTLDLSFGLLRRTPHVDAAKSLYLLEQQEDPIAALQAVAYSARVVCLLAVSTALFFRPLCVVPAFRALGILDAEAKCRWVNRYHGTLPSVAVDEREAIVANLK